MRNSLVALTLIIAGTANIAYAKDFPDKPIRLVVPTAPGGSIDAMARQIGDGLSKDLGVPVVVLNKPGASMIVATEFAAKSKPDGYTLLIGNTNLALNPVVQASLPYDTLRDLQPVSLLLKAANIVVVLPTSPLNTLDDLIAKSKLGAGNLKYASYGIGAPTHLAVEILRKKHKLNLIHLPYPGNAPALESLLGGHVDFLMMDTATAVPLIKAGRLKALAVAADKRLAVLPDVPTVVEANEPEMAHFPFQGVLVPAGTPPDIVAKLYGALVKITNSPEFKQQYEAQGYDVVSADGEAMRKTISEGIAKWKSIVDETGVQIQR